MQETEVNKKLGEVRNKEKSEPKGRKVCIQEVYIQEVGGGRKLEVVGNIQNKETGGGYPSLGGRKQE